MGERAVVPLGTQLVHPCPECGSAMVLRNSRLGLFYGCRSYPRCTATHGAHKATGAPLGIPADRATKDEAHIGRFDAAACQRLRALVTEHFPDLSAEEVRRG